MQLVEIKGDANGLPNGGPRSPRSPKAEGQREALKPRHEPDNRGMPISEAEQADLYTGLTEVIGQRRAEI